MMGVKGSPGHSEEAFINTVNGNVSIIPTNTMNSAGEDLFSFRIGRFGDIYTKDGELKLTLKQIDQLDATRREALRQEEINRKFKVDLDDHTI
jgi:hypothetical protein